MKDIDLLVVHALLVPIDEAMTVIPDGALAVHGGEILETGDTPTLTARYTPREILDARGRILMPGLINTHTHVGMAYFRGLADDLTLDDWLRQHIWPAEARHLAPEFVYHASLHGIAELALNGITLFNDMYFFERETARACREAGLRGMLGEGVLDFPVVGYTGPEAEIRYNLDAHGEIHDEQVQFTIAPHSIYACGPDTLRRCAEAAGNAGMRLHLHLSETVAEVENCRQAHGTTPALFLDRLGVLSANAILAHGTHLTAEECGMLARRGCGIAVCTESNLKLASGIAPLHLFRDHGVRFGLATDGVASNNNLDLLAELGTTALLHKAVRNDPTFLPARDLVKAVTIDAARVLGRDERLGSLEPGKLADFILVDSGEIGALPLYNVYSHLVYNLDSRHVTDVFVNGRPVVRDGHLTTLDGEELKRRARHYGAIVGGNGPCAG